MRININGDDIDFTLENEKTVGDVLSELRSWLGSTGMLISSVEIDNQKTSLDEKDSLEKPVEEIGRLSIEASSIRESRMKQLEIARDFFVILRNAAEAGDDKTLSELESSYQEFRAILPLLLGEKQNSLVVSELEKTLEQDHQKLIANSLAMLLILNDRLKEVENPVGEAKSAARKLTHLAKGLDDVAVNLQTGKDKKAMDEISRLCEVLQKFIRCLTWNAASGMDGIVDDMNKTLFELEEALIANDTVLIGDLLEYELKPRLMELPSRMEYEARSAR